MREHVLSKEMEGVLAQVSQIADGPENIFSMFNNADVKFGTIEDEREKSVELTHGRYIQFLESRDRRVRKELLNVCMKCTDSFAIHLRATFEANVKQAGFFAENEKVSFGAGSRAGRRKHSGDGLR